MAASPESEVEALALAALQVSQPLGDIRRLLEAHAAPRGTDDRQQLRRQWGMVLGGLGDAARAAGKTDQARQRYRQALAVLPEDPALLLNLGLAEAAAGDLNAAVRRYQQALRRDPRQPMAEVNLGNALEALEDTVGAVAAYQRAIALDLKQPAGMQVFHRLVADADIVVENFRPDVKHRLGIDYATLSASNPRLIYASISGFGEDGPYADRPGVDQVAQGMAGLMSVTGEAGRGPMRVGIALADLSAGLFAAMGILTALYERERSGRGQWVQTSLLAAQLFMLDFQGARWLMQGEVPQQSGNNHPTGVPTGSFRTRDGWANIAPTPPMWARFCKAIGHPEWIAHADYATPALRLLSQ
jgi:tetratricopeptide (TPR) repeat protein